MKTLQKFELIIGITLSASLKGPGLLGCCSAGYSTHSLQTTTCGYVWIWRGYESVI